MMWLLLPVFVRYAAMTPLMCWVIQEFPQYQFVHKYAAFLLTSPLSNRVLLANELSAVGGVMVVVYNALASILGPWIGDGWKTCLVAALDWIVFGIMFAALILQAGFIGLTVPRCNQIQPNGSMSGTDTITVFFERLARLNETDPYFGKHQCQDYLYGWYMGLTSLILYFFVAAINSCAVDTSWLSRASIYHERRGIRDWLVVIAKALYLVFVVMPNVALNWLWRQIPPRGRRLIYFYWRISLKRCYSAIIPLGAGHACKSRLMTRKTSSSNSNNNSNGNSGEARLMGLLSQWPIQQSIAKQLHYTDAIQLGLVSKRIRATMFPGGIDNNKNNNGDDDNEKLHQQQQGARHALRRYTCGNGRTPTMPCWQCGMQTCLGCNRTKHTTESRARTHQRLCCAQCTPCFYNHMLKLASGQNPKVYFSGLQCDCRDGRGNDLGANVIWSRSVFNPGSFQTLCRGCFKAAPVDAKSRERKDFAYYEARCRRGPPLQCYTCHATLSGDGTAGVRAGARWWICSQCNRECACMSRHSHWTTTEKKKKEKQKHTPAEEVQTPNSDGHGDIDVLKMV